MFKALRKSSGSSKCGYLHCDLVISHVMIYLFYFIAILLVVISKVLDFNWQGTTCDVREARHVKALVAFARDKLKYIDIWV